jgi:hypothetical protein
MEYRGIEYTIVQGIDRRRLWKWSAFVAGARIFGQESVRWVAVAAAESAIDRALTDPRKSTFRKPVDEINPRADELNSLRFELATFALQLDAFEARLKVRRGQTRKRATAADRATDAVTVADVPQAKQDLANQ